MAIERSIRGVTGFLQQNEDLIKDISAAASDAAGVIGGLSTRLDKNRSDAEELVANINGQAFAVAKDSNVKQRQEQLLEQIEQVSKDIQKFRDDEDILVHLYGQRGALYMALGNTYNDLVPQLVTFTQQEVDDLRVLLRRAVLDAAARQRQADVLDAAVQISKLALRVATKLA